MRIEIAFYENHEALERAVLATMDIDPTQVKELEQKGFDPDDIARAVEALDKEWKNLGLCEHGLGC